MSRSVKKTPACTDHSTPGSRWCKQQASKAVRRYTDDVPHGKWYRKLYCSWIICDYRFFKTRQQAIEEWETSSYPRIRALTRAEVINDWEQCFRRK
ncbi:hypothetical protein KIH86_24500 [Paenibacillus sp. HN-1]|uniref:hypothetical protein n=1 Tax=Paenibacillus TaxID=44249 RepID=UPI001CA9DE90|nr:MULTISPECIES: hypothetical protein [Paenibacillus]MBY9079186.1 hypothetical protein [Paenibacillus sp. CGMCC 1.18879]MBY9087349.1 hypothetical protein [Paenibacillus sinensis]